MPAWTGPDLHLVAQPLGIHARPALIRPSRQEGTPDTRVHKDELLVPLLHSRVLPQHLADRSEIHTRVLPLHDPDVRLARYPGEQLTRLPLQDEGEVCIGVQAVVEEEEGVLEGIVGLEVDV